YHLRQMVFFQAAVAVGWVEDFDFLRSKKRNPQPTLINSNEIITYNWIYRGAGIVLNSTIYGRWYSFRPQ
ncbi:MAG: hypothetical protein DRI57_16715, partial [Deltaproteobacteria bacterium]